MKLLPFLTSVLVLRCVTFAATPPNVVFILADDLGWSDTTLYGQTKFYETPNIQRLAQRGMLFTNAYAANPLCSPTRASILTGLYPGRLGITAPAGHLPEEKLEARLVAKPNSAHKAIETVSATRLDTRYETLAKTLQRAGYATGHFGKWHLGAEPYTPLQHGFDIDLPHYNGPGPAGSYMSPWKFPATLNFFGQPNEHIEERMSSEALKFIEANRDRPFYLNYWAFSVHAPFDGKPVLIEKYRKKAHAADEQRCPVYGAMVHSLDDAVGALLDKLDALKLSERTIVVFFSDNGGNMYDRVDGIPPTSNRPLRGGKATLFEGGTREPCVVVWPGRVAPGTKTDALLSSVDFYPTLLEMAGIAAQPGQPFDGLSQVPALLGKAAPRDTAFCFFPHYTPATGAIPAVWVRHGPWKLIRFFYDGPAQEHRYELYNLETDLGEAHDLALREVAKVRELDALIDAHLSSTAPVLPERNPAYKMAAETSVFLAGWTASKDTQLTIVDEELRIESSGGDPWIATREVPAARGPMTVEWSMKSTAKGDGQIMFTTNGKERFGQGKSVTFSPTHDGAFHDYQVTLADAERVHALRLDPATAAGSITIRQLMLRDAKGSVVKEYQFKGAAAEPTSAPAAGSKEVSASVIVPKRLVSLFDGRSFNGWTAFAKDNAPLEEIWSVRDGVIHCVGKPNGYLRTVQPYANYLLTVEWRFIKPGNTGVIVHANGGEKLWQASVECQGAHGRQGDFYLWSGLQADQPFTKGKTGIPAGTPGVEKPIGEWNVYQVRCAGAEVVISVNGMEVNRITGCSAQSGWIGLQSEGAEFEVRKVVLEPLSPN